MKTTVRVMLSALCFGIAAKAAGQNLDREIVIVGNDESEMSLPAPWMPPWPALPPVSPFRAGLRFLPPLMPPKGDWMRLHTGRRIPDILRDWPDARPLYPDASP
jgi:hypothetical protein